ncbi:26629_t:CDS:1, partial [Racocetra persica]
EHNVLTYLTVEQAHKTKKKKKLGLLRIPNPIFLPSHQPSKR